MKHSLLVCSFACVAVGLAACASTAGAERPPANAHAPDAHAPSQPAHPQVDAEDPTEQELAAYERARPIFESYCAKCHTRRGSKSSPEALTHFSMDSYPFGGHHAHEITATLRKALGAAGSPPTMPSDAPGAVQGDELRRILEWADAYERAHATPPAKHDHEHGGSAHEH